MGNSLRGWKGEAAVIYPKLQLPAPVSKEKHGARAAAESRRAAEEFATLIQIETA
jgi:hypothetical protein